MFWFFRSRVSSRQKLQYDENFLFLSLIELVLTYTPQPTFRSFDCKNKIQLFPGFKRVNNDVAFRLNQRNVTITWIQKVNIMLQSTSKV